MDRLVIVLALNGALVLLIAMLAGLFLYLSILRQRDQDAWHLLHTGGAGRGVMLLALAALVEYPDLPPAQLDLAVWLILFFVWSSMLAMGIRALVGARGLRFDGGFANRLVWISYALGALAVFPGLLLLIYGFGKALWPS